MTLGLFWSRYELELHEKNLREIDAKYTYLIHYEMWNWLIAKIPEKGAGTDPARTQSRRRFLVLPAVGGAYAGMAERKQACRCV